MDKLNDYNLVEKSRALVWAKFRDYTAGELRLLEVYLSRINPRNPDSANVTFTLAEYRRLLGLPRLEVDNIRPQLKHFLGNVVTIPGSGKNATFYTLFTRADIRKNGNSYVISISCNPDLREVFFDLAQIGYVRYRLYYTLSMKSQYSILLYSILRDWLTNQQEVTKQITVERLREQLGATDDSYKNFKDFKRRVLDRATREINELSDLDVAYEKIKHGKQITSITFHVTKKATDSLPTPNRPATKAISTETRKTSSTSQRPVKTPQNGRYGNVDWNIIAPCLDEPSIRKIADAIYELLQSDYPEIPESQLPTATLDTLTNAYNDILPLTKANWPDNPAGYLYSVITQEGKIGYYLPSTYTMGVI